MNNKPIPISERTGRPMFTKFYWDLLCERQGKEKLKIEEMVNNGEYWVIQRNDGCFICNINNKVIFDNDISNVIIFKDKNKFTNGKQDALDYINMLKNTVTFSLQNCKPVKIQIKIVGEKDDIQRNIK